MTSIETICDLTSNQLGMFLQAQADPRRGAFVEQLRLELAGAIDPRALSAAWQDVTDRHAALRTSIHHAGRTIVQIVQSSVTADCAVERDDVIDEDEDEDEDENEEQARLKIARRLEAERERGFELTRAPLARLTLLIHRTSADSNSSANVNANVNVNANATSDRATLVLTWHHIVMDGWSMSVLLEDLAQAYLARRRGEPPMVAAALSTIDYVKHLKTQPDTDARAFWTNALAGATPSPIGTSTPGLSHIVEATLPVEETTRLDTWRRARRVSMAAVINAAWAEILRDFTGSSDVIFGTTTSGRGLDMPGLERAVGLLANTVPVRATLQSDLTVGALVDRMHEAGLARGPHEWVPAVTMSNWLGRGHGQLFDSLVVVENYPLGELEARRWADLTVDSWEYAGAAAPYAITLLLMPGDALHLRLDIARGIVDPRDAGDILQTLLAELRTWPQRSDDVLRPTGLRVSCQRDLTSHAGAEAADVAGTMTPTERELVGIVRELLHVERVEATDRFFDLGGHSLAALDLVGVVQDRFGVELSVADIFRFSASLRELAAHVDGLRLASADTAPCASS